MVGWISAVVILLVFGSYLDLDMDCIMVWYFACAHQQKMFAIEEAAVRIL